MEQRYYPNIKQMNQAVNMGLARGQHCPVVRFSRRDHGDYDPALQLPLPHVLPE